jgi:PAS domain S-box-containing protein
MSAYLVSTLYLTSGVCAYAAAHHALAARHRPSTPLHPLFALLSLTIMGFVLAKAGSYQASSVDGLVLSRQWEITFLSGFFAVLPWFIAEYTGYRPRWLLRALTLVWCLLLAANWLLPYGLQFAEEPTLDHFLLPWGETVVDLRPHRASGLYLLAWASILALFTYSFRAAQVQHRQGQRRRAWALFAAMGVFLAFMVSALAANLDLVEFVPAGEFGFLALLVMMDAEMMLQSRLEKQQMRGILDALPAAIVLRDARGRFQFANRQYRSSFDLGEADVIGRSDFDVHPPPLAEHLRGQWQHALARREASDGEEVLDIAGCEHHFETRHIPLLLDGAAHGVCSIHLDVTDARRKDAMLDGLRRQVWHTDRVASTSAISASLAHEISQPLSAILNNAQAGLRFLSSDAVDVTEIRDLLQDIVRDDKRAAAIISGLRAMLQPQEFTFEGIDLAGAIGEVLELLHSELLRHGVDATVDLMPGLMVRANRTQIQQVVLNLLLNAVEAMEPQAEGTRALRVDMRRQADKAVVSISDTGPGIAPDLLERVFEGFYTTKPHGLGVGLEVCRSILESHHGSIWAEPNRGRGVSFRFSLPLAADPGPAAV